MDARHEGEEALMLLFAARATERWPRGRKRHRRGSGDTAGGAGFETGDVA